MKYLFVFYRIFRKIKLTLHQRPILSYANFILPIKSGILTLKLNKKCRHFSFAGILIKYTLLYFIP